MVMVMVSVLCCVGYEHPGAVSGSEDDLQCVLYDGHWCAGTEVQILLLQMPLYAACSWLVVVDACSVLLLLLLLLLVVVVVVLLSLFVVVVFSCEYDSKKQLVSWKIKKMPGGTEHTLRSRIVLTKASTSRYNTTTPT